MINPLTLTDLQLEYLTALALGHESLISNGGVGPVYLTSTTKHPFNPLHAADDLMPALLQAVAILRFHDETGTLSWRVRVNGSSVFMSAVSLPLAVCRAVVAHALEKSPDRMKLPAATGGASYQSDSTECEDLF